MFQESAAGHSRRFGTKFNIVVALLASFNDKGAREGAFVLYNVELRFTRVVRSLGLNYRIVHHRANLPIASHNWKNSQQTGKSFIYMVFVEKLCISRVKVCV